MKNKAIYYSSLVIIISFMIMTVIQIRQTAQMETTITELRSSDSVKGDSIKLLTSALKSQLESHCDTMTVEQRLKLLEFQKYEVRMWNEKEKAITAAYTQKEKANMAAYKQKENATMKNWLVFDKTKYNSLKQLSEQYPKEFVQYVVALFWKDHSSGEDSYKYWEEFEKIEKIPGIKEHVTLEKQAYSTYEAVNKKLEAEYSEATKKNEQSYESQKKALGQKYDDLIAQKKAALGL